MLGSRCPAQLPIFIIYVFILALNLIAQILLVLIVEAAATGRHRFSTTPHFAPIAGTLYILNGLLGTIYIPYLFRKYHEIPANPLQWMILSTSIGLVLGVCITIIHFCTSLSMQHANTYSNRILATVVLPDN